MAKGKVDPISGNEIPVGATAKNVRDDIPAMLSEDEFVIPANVVKYYGTKHFYDLMRKAKDDLGDHDKDGPEDQAEEDDFPFDISELQFEEDAPVEMAEGGEVPRKLPDWLTRALNPETPTLDDEEGSHTVLTESANVDGRVLLYPTVRMVDGKIVKMSSEDALKRAQELGDYFEFPTEDEATNFSKSLSSWIQSARGMAEGGLVEPDVVKYQGPGGIILDVPFVNGRATEFIPAGYVRMDTPVEFKSTRAPEEKDEDYRVRERRNVDPSQWDFEDFNKFNNQGKFMKTIGLASSALGPGGMLVGGLANLAYRETRKQAMQELQARIKSDDTSDDDRTKYSEMLSTFEGKGKDGEDKPRGLIEDLFGDKGSIVKEKGLFGLLFNKEEEKEEITDQPVNNGLPG